MKSSRYSRLMVCMVCFMMSLLLVSCSPDEDALLETALHDENADNRLEAAQALKELGSSTSADALLDAALHDESIDYRLRAAQALKELGNGSSADSLLAAALNDADETVRLRAVKALGIIGGDDAVDALAKVVGLSENTQVRSDLAKYGDGYAGLTAALSDEDEYVKNYAEKALEAVNTSELGVEESARIWLEDLLDIRCYAIQALTETGSERAAEALVTALKNEDINIILTAEGALIKMKSVGVVDDLTAILDDQSLMWPRYSAARILGEIGDKRAADKLLETMQFDDDRQLKIYAADALEKIGDGNASAEAHRYILYCSYKDYIKAGDSNEIPMLIQSLYSYGDKEMAEAFLNCGNFQLSEAAKSWAREHGYYITTSSGGGYAYWGSG